MARSAQNKRPITDPEVAQVFDRCPPKIRRELLTLRDLILETAENTDGVGRIEETLKWGEPSYLTSGPKSGTTIRINKTKNPDEYALFVPCQTTLIGEFRALFPREFTYDGKRAIVFTVGQSWPKAKLRHCIARALTYHLKSG